MTCEEVELALSSGDPLSDSAQAHLQSCESCRAFAAELPGLLSDAALPELSAAERTKLDGLTMAVLRQYRADRPRVSGVRQFVSLALAAGVGALVTSAVFKLSPQAPQSKKAAPQVVQLAADPSGLGDSAFELASADDATDDDASLEVSWPSLNEGDVP